jgi:hypothetical protein
MKPLVIVSLCATLSLVGLVVYRAAFKTQTPSPTEQQIQQAEQMADHFAKIKTRPVSKEEFHNAIARKIQTELTHLPEKQREKLATCLERFYDCYSSGEFEAFRRFRLHQPFAIKMEIAQYFKQNASSQGIELKSDEELLRFGWGLTNGTNRIGQVNLESVAVSLVKKQDLTKMADLRRPSAGDFPGIAVTCWEGVVSYEPAPGELLTRDGEVSFIKLEVFVRFDLTEGPATPLTFLAYWDSQRGDWMPYALCSVLRVNNYRTML